MSEPVIVLSELFVVVVLAIAAVTDIRGRTIPNFLSLILVAGFVFLAVLRPELREVAAYRAAAASLAFVFGLAMFSAGVMGGGDVKLFSALILWHSIDNIGALILAVGVSGALVSIYYTAVEYAALQRTPAGESPAGATLKQALQTKIPYAVAILMGHLIVRFSSII